jgi:hypothetical protein
MSAFLVVLVTPNTGTKPGELPRETPGVMFDPA